MQIIRERKKLRSIIASWVLWNPLVVRHLDLTVVKSLILSLLTTSSHR